MANSTLLKELDSKVSTFQNWTWGVCAIKHHNCCSLLRAFTMPCSHNYSLAAKQELATSCTFLQFTQPWLFYFTFPAGIETPSSKQISWNASIAQARRNSHAFSPCRSLAVLLADLLRYLTQACSWLAPFWKVGLHRALMISCTITKLGTNFVLEQETHSWFYKRFPVSLQTSEWKSVIFIFSLLSFFPFTIACRHHI